jgi:polyvinyl alcohol dehydrogenase (cytochrome)
MRRCAAGALCAVLTLACGSEVEEPVGPELGALIYEERCEGCHDGRVSRAPSPEMLQGLPPAAILAAIERGIMRDHVEGTTAAERRAVAEFLGGPVSETETIAACPPGQSAATGLDASPLASGWSVDVRNTRFQPRERAGFARSQAAQLELAWAFHFPGASKARSLPAVAGDSLFVGSLDGTVYALSRDSGCVRWRFRADSEVRTAISFGPAQPGGPPLVYFSDFGAVVYALDARTGYLVWRKRVHDHAHATGTGSPRLHEGRLYVPVSSYEVAVAMNPRYACCTFRGAVVALDARDGRVIWRAHTVERPVPRGRNFFLARKHGPSGAPVWTSPAIDIERGQLYVGTGENYSTPWSRGSDAIFAIRLSDGMVRWVRQTTRRDAYTMACYVPGKVNCPDEDGPDFDYGASPVLVRLLEGRDIVVAAQKSGMVHGLNPRDGEVLWRTRVGRGGTLGGVHWGLAAQGGRVYVPVSDREDGRTYATPARPGLVALDAATGEVLWRIDAPDECGGQPTCFRGFSAAPYAIEGAVFIGSLDGHLRAYAGANGDLLLDLDTRGEQPDAMGGPGHGGAIDGPGPLPAGGFLYVNTGYGQFGQMPGSLLLAYAPKK